MELIVVDRDPDAVGLASSVGYGEDIGGPAIDIISAEINIIGNLVGSFNDLCDLMALAARGAVSLHADKCTLDDVQSAIGALDAGRCAAVPS